MNAELTTDIVNKVESALNTIAAKIGVGVDHFWPIFVKQQITSAIPLIGLVLLGVIIVITMLLISRFGYKKNVKLELENTFDQGNVVGPLIAAGVSGFLTFLGIVTIVTSNIPQLLNPEYYALRSVIEMLR